MDINFEDITFKELEEIYDKMKVLDQQLPDI